MLYPDLRDWIALAVSFFVHTMPEIVHLNCCEIGVERILQISVSVQIALPVAL
jgi:hypothetical protein